MNGVIVINKPQGFTSFDAAAIMRGCFHTKKVGHSGTLDPNATGVLPIFIGAAAKAVSLLPETGKSYRGAFRLGITSDTLDIWGNCSEQKDVRISEEILREALGQFRGNIMQTPPMYSALKVNGKKLCDLARQGITVERRPREVTISRLELTEFDGRDGVIEVDCSSGTYIRALIDDIGAAVGTGAVMTALERTRACGFTIEESYPLVELKTKPLDDLERLLKPVDSLFTCYPAVYLDGEQTRLYMNGVRLDKRRLNAVPEGMCRVYGSFPCEKFIGLAGTNDEGLVSVKRLDGDRI